MWAVASFGNTYFFLLVLAQMSLLSNSRIRLSHTHAPMRHTSLSSLSPGTEFGKTLLCCFVTRLHRLDTKISKGRHL